MKFLELEAEIINIIDLNSDLYQVIVRTPQIAEMALPGQFVGVKVRNASFPLLRRPLSIWSAREEYIEFLLRVLGEGTRALIESKQRKLSLLGPLGNSFPPPPENKSLIFIGGGTGLAPLSFFSERNSQNKRVCLFGMRSEPPSYLLNRIEEVYDFSYISTDDGSYGFKGTVFQLLDKLKEGEINFDKSYFYVSGPYPLLKKCQEVLPHNRTYISVEGMMACGFGVCMGCAVKKRKEPGYFRSCTEGPIFLLEDVEL